VKKCILLLRPTGWDGIIARAFMRDRIYMKTIFIARQPIFNRQREVFAYELLYRQTAAADSTTLITIDPNMATAQVLVNFIQHLGIKQLKIDQPVFVNFTDEFLNLEIYTPLPPDRVILDVIKTAADLRTTIDNLRKIKENGFRFAYEITNYSDVNDLILQMASYIRIDISSFQSEEMDSVLRRLEDSPAKKIAVKVETQEAFQLAKEHGFDYFQGFFLCRPETIGNEIPELSANHAVLMNLISKLQNPQIELETVQSLLSCDPQLTIQLLKIVNSAAYVLPQKISAITEAVRFLGLNFVRNWSLMLSMANLTDVPHELTSMAMLRAKMCSSLAQAMKLQNPEHYFTVGLLSMLDGILNRPMASILAELPLSADVNEALLQRSGSLGQVLLNVERYEKADWDNIDLSQISEENYCTIYMESMDWLHEVMGSVG
jgi:c-di-GMP phosphodiesterase